MWLREHGEDEFQRASVCSQELLNMATHVQLRVHYSPATEKLDQDDPTDWKVRAADDLF